MNTLPKICRYHYNPKIKTKGYEKERYQNQED